MWPFSKPFGGLIQGHHLGNWWSSLSSAERAQIKQAIDQPASLFHPLDTGPARTMRPGAKRLLVDLAGWFTRDDCRALGRKIMAQAESLPHDAGSVIELHLTLSAMIQFHYRCRNDGPEHLPKCEAFCREMISIAPLAARGFKTEFPKSNLPCHLGYGRLSWLLNKRGDPEGAQLRLEGESAGWIVSI
jgi:hypothetical protein